MQAILDVSGIGKVSEIQGTFVIHHQKNLGFHSQFRVAAFFT